MMSESSVFSNRITNVPLDHKLVSINTTGTQKVKQNSDAIVAEIQNGNINNLKDNLQAAIEQSEIFSEFEVSDSVSSNAACDSSSNPFLSEEQEDSKMEEFETKDDESNFTVSGCNVIEMSSKFELKDSKLGENSHQSRTNSSTQSKNFNSELHKKFTEPFQEKDFDEQEILRESDIPLEKEKLNGISHNKEAEAINDINETKAETRTSENSSENEESRESSGAYENKAEIPTSDESSEDEEASGVYENKTETLISEESSEDEETTSGAYKNKTEDQMSEESRISLSNNDSETCSTGNNVTSQHADADVLKVERSSDSNEIECMNNEKHLIFLSEADAKEDLTLNEKSDNESISDNHSNSSHKKAESLDENISDKDAESPINDEIPKEIDVTPQIIRESIKGVQDQLVTSSEYVPSQFSESEFCAFQEDVESNSAVSSNNGGSVPHSFIAEDESTSNDQAMEDEVENPSNKSDARQITHTIIDTVQEKVQVSIPDSNDKVSDMQINDTNISLTANSDIETSNSDNLANDVVDVETSKMTEDTTDDRTVSINPLLQNKNDQEGNSPSHEDSDCDMFEDYNLIKPKVQELENCTVIVSPKDDIKSDIESSHGSRICLHSDPLQIEEISYTEKVNNESEKIESHDFSHDSKNDEKIECDVIESCKKNIIKQDETKELKNDILYPSDCSLKIERTCDSGMEPNLEFGNDESSNGDDDLQDKNKMDSAIHNKKESDLDSNIDTVSCSTDTEEKLDLVAPGRITDNNDNKQLHRDINWSIDSCSNISDGLGQSESVKKSDDSNISSLGDTLTRMDKSESSGECIKSNYSESINSLNDVAMIDVSVTQKELKDVLKEPSQIQNMVMECDTLKVSEASNTSSFDGFVSVDDNLASPAVKFGLKECKVNLSESRISESVFLNASQDLLLNKPNFRKLKRKLEDMLQNAQMEEDKAIQQLKKMREEKAVMLKEIVGEIKKVKKKLNL